MANMEKQMESTIEAVNETGLTKILQDSKLELTEAETIKQSYLPYFEQMGMIKEEAKKINFENPTLLDEKIARDLRLRTVKIRTGSESVKEERKKIHQLKANVEQQAWNLIKSTCQLDEELFLQVEKKREIQESKRKQELKEIRIAELSLFEVQTEFIDLANMPEDAYTQLYESSKLAHEQKLEGIRQAEIARLKKEQDEADERERQRKENEKLKAEAAKREKQIAVEREKTEVERLRIEALHKAEQIKSDKILKDQQEKAAKEKAEADKKLKAAEDEKKLIAAKLKANQDKEIADEKARILAMKKAQAAPDKEKLRQLSIDINSIAFPDLTTDEGKVILSEIQILLEKVRLHIGQRCSTL